MRCDLHNLRNATRLTFAATAIFVPALPCLATGTTTIFAPGVTADSGWYDVTKKSTQARAYKDSNMCWAAVSSTLIQYWQDSYVAAGNELPEGTPNGSGTKTYFDMGCYESAIFECYMDNWDLTTAGQIVMGVPWYFSGECPNYSNTSKPITSNSGGYFKNEYASLQKVLGENFTMNSYGAYSAWGPWAPDQSRKCLDLFSERVSEILQKGAGGIEFAAGAGHTATLWGADFDASGMVSAVYLTDSDDRATTLVDGEAKPTLTRYAITSNDSDRSVYLCNYNPDNKFGNVKVTSLFGLAAYPIPEPSAFGLLAGTCALAIVAARRRTKKT
ncbi:MAG: IdeS/Mac family cysteine endopeptidase [Opitutales bacterium]|nr:IdeS/Mac family cysteine endopeptidase [Opitutales bacterium]